MGSYEWMVTDRIPSCTDKLLSRFTAVPLNCCKRGEESERIVVDVVRKAVVIRRRINYCCDHQQMNGGRLSELLWLIKVGKPFIHVAP